MADRAVPAARDVTAILRLALDLRTVTPRFPGIGRYAASLAAALGAARDLELTLLCPPSAAASLPEVPRERRIVCAASPLSIRQQWVVARLLRRAGVQAYHSPYYVMPYRPGVPAAVTCYDLIPRLHPEYFSAAERLTFRVAHGLALRTASIVLAVSETTRADLVRLCRVDPARVVVTPLAAASPFRPYPADAVAAVRGRLALDGPYALYVGTNKPHKNLGRLVRAWHLSGLGTGPRRWRLVIAGPWDPRYPEAERLVRQLGLDGVVVFAGVVPEDDLPALYGGAGLFVCPSLHEGFGLPVLEAMACGAPVACSRAGALREVAGDAAVLFEPRDVGAIAEALRRVAGDRELGAELRRRGMARAAQFDWQTTGQRTVDAYRRIA
jgi:alpha-1,3-rhamnosyl/mannosyltransferase